MAYTSTLDIWPLRPDYIHPCLPMAAEVRWQYHLHGEIRPTRYTVVAFPGEILRFRIYWFLTYHIYIYIFIHVCKIQLHLNLMEDVPYVTFYWTKIKTNMYNMGEYHSSVFGIMNTPLPLDTCQCHMHRPGWNLSLGRRTDISIFNYVFNTHTSAHINITINIYTYSFVSFLC